MGDVDADRSGSAGTERPIPFQATLVGTTPSSAAEFESALRNVCGLPVGVRAIEHAAQVPFPNETVHAIVFDSSGLSKVTADDAFAVRQATSVGTCRAYLWRAPGAPEPPEFPLLDDFLQKTPRQDTEGAVREIAAFFRDADALNRTATIRGSRDAFCILVYSVLQPLWPLSYLAAALHAANAIASLAGVGPWPGFIESPYVAWPAIFLGAFFVSHCAYRIVVNFLFSTKILRRLTPDYFVVAAFLTAAAGLTVYSSIALSGSVVAFAMTLVAAAAVFALYLYAMRIRAECSSLSQLHSALSDRGNQRQVLDFVGRSPFTPDSFPFVAYSASPIFISYMHRSAWSRSAALAVREWALSQGKEAFLDGSSIPPGALWRQYLLRALSECGTFVAVIDGHADVTDWVLTESAFAALLRKQVGKPRILLVVQNEAALDRFRQGPFGALYRDVFEMPSELRYGIEILLADSGGLTSDRLEASCRRIRPMSLAG